MHDLLVIAIPTIAVMFGIMLNRQDATAIRAEIGQLRSETKGGINSLRAEMISLRDSIHRDMIGLHERLAVVEAGQNN